MKKDLTFSKAWTELEKLVIHIESDEVPLEKLAAHVKKASELIRFCETRLRLLETDIEKAAGRVRDEREDGGG